MHFQEELQEEEQEVLLNKEEGEVFGELFSLDSVDVMLHLRNALLKGMELTSYDKQLIGTFISNYLKAYLSRKKIQEQVHFREITISNLLECAEEMSSSKMFEILVRELGMYSIFQKQQRG